MGTIAWLAVLVLATPAAADPLRIVLDPGHGGSNLGAAGAVDGVLEKRLTLAIARLVRDEILQLSPEADVGLTRDDDRFVTLSKRADVANQAGATAFVSLHLNASHDRRQSGLETYVHGQGTLIEPGERDPQGIDDGVREILADLCREATLAESAHLAALVQRHVAGALGPVGDRGIKRAPFDVLFESRVPSVLVEVGFIDHAEEGPRMVDPDVQRVIARAIALALVEFGSRREAKRIIFAAHP